MSRNSREEKHNWQQISIGFQIDAEGYKDKEWGCVHVVMRGRKKEKMNHEHIRLYLNEWGIELPKDLPSEFVSHIMESTTEEKTEGDVIEEDECGTEDYDGLTISVCDRCAGDRPVCGDPKPGGGVYTHAETCDTYDWADSVCDICTKELGWESFPRVSLCTADE